MLSFRSTALFCLSVSVSTASSFAGLVTVNFDTFPGGGVPSSAAVVTNQYNSLGVMFSSGGAGPRIRQDTQFSSSPNFLVGGSNAGEDPFAPIVVDFINGTSASVNVTLISVGDATVKATAFSSDLITVLDSISVTNPGAGVAPGPGAFDPITLNGPNVARVRFEITQPFPGDGYGIDDLVFDFQENQSVVPEPSSLTLLGMGAVSLFGFGWRRKRKLKA